MKRFSNIILWTICVSLWTSAFAAQTVAWSSTGEETGQITIAPHADSIKIDKELKSAVDSLSAKSGIILDLRRVSASGQIYSEPLAAAINSAFAGYTKPTVVLFGGTVNWESSLGKWAKEREWTRFESSGELKQAEAKLTTLRGRHLREGQERMNYLMQQQKKEGN